MSLNCEIGHRSGRWQWRGCCVRIWLLEYPLIGLDWLRCRCGTPVECGASEIIGAVETCCPLPRVQSRQPGILMYHRFGVLSALSPFANSYTPKQAPFDITVTGFCQQAFRIYPPQWIDNCNGRCCLLHHCEHYLPQGWIGQ